MQITTSMATARLIFQLILITHNTIYLRYQDQIRIEHTPLPRFRPLLKCPSADGIVEQYASMTITAWVIASKDDDFSNDSWLHDEMHRISRINRKS